MKKIVLNFIYQSLFQVLTIILPIITIPIVSRALGAEGIGLWGFTNSIVSYFLLIAGLGMANYAVREIAYVKNDRGKLSEKFWELQFFNMIFSGGVLIVYILFFLITRQHYLYLIQTFMIVGILLDISWLFQGVEDFKRVALINSAVKLIAVLFVILFINNINDLWIYGMILSLTPAFSAILLWKSATKYVDFKKISIQSILSHFHPALNFFILKISATIFMNINRTLLGFFSTLIMVGYFVNSLQIIILLGTIIGALNQVMLPRMSNLQREANEEEFISTIQKTIHIQLFFSIALMFGVVAINEQLIGWFFGEDFYFIKNIIPILAPVIVLQQLQQGVANQYLVPKNELKFYNLTMLIGTSVNVLICLILIPVFHIYGAVIGFLLGQALLAITRVGVMLKKSSFEFNYVNIIKWILSGIVMMLLVIVLTQSLPATIFTTVIQGLLGGIVYMFTTYILKVNPLKDFLK